MSAAAVMATESPPKMRPSTRSTTLPITSEPMIDTSVDMEFAIL